jgi:hypothetical protein
MANQNLNQIFIANPITSNAATDLLYFMRSPYNAGTDAAMTYSNFAAQFGSPYTPSALTKTDDTNVTLTLGGIPATALLHAVSFTLGWTGQLGVARGGSGLAAITAHNLPIGNGTSALTLLAPSATSGIPLISQGASANPAYGTALVAGGGTGNTTFTAYSVICAGTTATGAFQNVSGLGSSGNVLTSNGPAALPSWQAPAGGGITSAGIASNQVLIGASSSSAASSSAYTFDSTNFNLQMGGSNTFPGPCTYGVIFGFTNSIQGTGSYCSILAGNNNTLDSNGGSATVIISGDHNTGSGNSSAILSGSNHSLNDPNRGLITHGHACNIQGDYSIVGGETCTANGSYSFVMGYHGSSSNNGSFIWADHSSASTFADSAANQFLVRAAGGFYFNTATSTTAVQIDTSSNLINLKGTSDQSFSYQTPATGFSITIGAGVKTLILDPAGTLATGTITMPASPINGQEIRFSSSQIITGLTVSANSGQTISNAPTTITAGMGFGYIYRTTSTNWYRLY